MRFEELLPTSKYASHEGEEVSNLARNFQAALADAIEQWPTRQGVEELSLLYTRLTSAIVSFRVKTADHQRLAFTEGERLLIDFGFLDRRLLETELDVVAFCREEMIRPEIISGIRIP